MNLKMRKLLIINRDILRFMGKEEQGPIERRVCFPKSEKDCLQRDAEDSDRDGRDPRKEPGAAARPGVRPARARTDTRGARVFPKKRKGMVFSGTLKTATETVALPGRNQARLRGPVFGPRGRGPVHAGRVCSPKSEEGLSSVGR